MIPFNKPLLLNEAFQALKDIPHNHKLSGDGQFNKACSKLIQEKFNSHAVMLTPSCTASLEITALLLDLKPGDEVIMPSYTFVSTANAYALRGAKIVFVDIRPDTMNIDENLIEPAITDKTKAIVIVHYAGVSCEMNKIMEIAKKYDLPVIEDAAQAVGSKYHDQYLGAIGDLGCYSFHETKNLSCGEGGALLVNNSKFKERAEIIREKGTNRSKFFRGEIDKYTWVDIGSSYLLSELCAAYLYPQLNVLEEINDSRMVAWNNYYETLKPLEEAGFIDLPHIPEHCTHNAHMFYLKTKSLETREGLIQYLKHNGISTVFHYVPLHSSDAGQKYSRFHGEDRWTTHESERLVRLPLWYQMPDHDISHITSMIHQYFENT